MTKNSVSWTQPNRAQPRMLYIRTIRSAADSALQSKCGPSG